LGSRVENFGANAAETGTEMNENLILGNLAADIGAWCALICFLASLLLRLIPTPLRFHWRWYRCFYSVVRWLALNNGWKVRR